MDLSVSEKHWQHLRQLVDSGRYPSADAAIARALALLEEQDLADSDPAVAAELAARRNQVMAGVDDLRNGRYTVYTNETLPELFDAVKRRGRERRAIKTAQSWPADG